MIKQSQFKPAWWLPGPHLQTLWPVVSRRLIKVASRRERLELPDGDFLDLDWVGDQGPIVLILHGLGGSIRSPYARGVLRSIAKTGCWRAVFVHFRGCSEEFNRLPRRYHSGETSDLAVVVAALQKREPNTPMAAVGYSLGGNVLLKWLGETQGDNPLTSAVAISVPFELKKAAERIDEGMSRMYQWWLLRQLKKETLEKFKIIPSIIDLDNVKKVRCFPEFDEQVTAPLHGFADADAYYQQSSARQYLRNIKVPTLVLHAADDPFMPAEVIPEPHELSPHVNLELSQRGGHVGFVAGTNPLRPKYWLEERMVSYLREYLG